jgi:hypothetical protein
MLHERQVPGLPGAEQKIGEKQYKNGPKAPDALAVQWLRRA